ncbi:hypothetical protein F1188_19850 [Roseospira marina]|uniref:DUF3168 domain-containing protein n=1 Tax=Roseospira marina TaxID=140057 RepID=A0A5M6I4T3_9PROT|nr:hypothetical protein [Roseospira marina]KAA5603236.1 hypothetical protein F1188_19850 [Roseospira marina]MBB4316171.1 hypothetical protein [Roseospira marina]MBB5089370.1 hypothetical protein [Roseospira marina]
MALTPRETIRCAVRTALRGADDARPATDAGRTVFASRCTPLAPRLLPAILVYTQSDRRDRDRGGGVIQRHLDVVVEVAAQGEAADATVDRLSMQVEAALDADPTLGGAVQSIAWESSEADYDGEGAQATAGLRLTFTAVYATVPPDGDDGPLPAGVYASWAPDIGPPHEPDYVDLAETFLPDVRPNDGTRGPEP